MPTSKWTYATELKRLKISMTDNSKYLSHRVKKIVGLAQGVITCITTHLCTHLVDPPPNGSSYCLNGKGAGNMNISPCMTGITGSCTDGEMKVTGLDPPS